MKRLWLILAALATSTLAGCGGGGGDPGRCIFPVACTQVASPATPSAGGQTSSQFTRSGSGPASFTLPADVTTIRIQGQTASNSSNFIVYAGSSLVVNVIVGNSQIAAQHDGTYVVAGGASVNITNATGVEWTVSSATVSQPPMSASFAQSGTGDSVFTLPSRSARYRIKASYPGASSNFIVNVSGQLLVNEIIGLNRNPSTFDGTFLLPVQGRVEITNSSGVVWSFVETN